MGLWRAHVRLGWTRQGTGIPFASIGRQARITLESTASQGTPCDVSISFPAWPSHLRASLRSPPVEQPSSVRRRRRRRPAAPRAEAVGLVLPHPLLDRQPRLPRRDLPSSPARRVRVPRRRGRALALRQAGLPHRRPTRRRDRRSAPARRLARARCLLRHIPRRVARTARTAEPRRPRLQPMKPRRHPACATCRASKTAPIDRTRARPPDSMGHPAARRSGPHRHATRYRRSEPCNLVACFRDWPARPVLKRRAWDRPPRDCPASRMQVHRPPVDRASDPRTFNRLRCSTPASWQSAMAELLTGRATTPTAVSRAPRQVA